MRPALLSLVLLAAACAPVPSVDLAGAPSGAFKLDPEHGSLVFSLSHGGGLSRYVARFDRFDAALDFDPEHPEASKVEAVIEAASVSTANPPLDAALIGQANLLDAERHPQITFRSTQVTPTGPASARVTGELTLRGVSRPVTLEVVYNGGARDPLRGGKQVIGFSATGAFPRSDFGADAFVNFGVGDEVAVSIQAEFIRR